MKAEIWDLDNVAKNLYCTIFFHKYKNHINLHFIVIYLIYYIALISGVQHIDSVLLQIVGYYKTMAVIPCAIQYNAVTYLIKFLF